jgi:hypothetical protein
VAAVEAVGVADLDGEGDRECWEETRIIEEERGEADSGGCSWDGRGGKESGLSDIERARCHETFGIGLPSKDWRGARTVGPTRVRGPSQPSPDGPGQFRGDVGGFVIYKAPIHR